MKLKPNIRDTTVKVVILCFFGLCYYEPRSSVHAGMIISSSVIPSESRRQGLVQEDPCPGDTVVFTCTINGSSTGSTLLSWTANGSIVYLIALPDNVGNPPRISVSGITGTAVNATTSTLSINLGGLDPNARVITNGTEVSCVEGATTTSETFTIIGIASAPTVTVRPEGLSRLTIDMTAPVYGRECVDMYRATAVVGGVTLPTIEQTVTDSNQDMYRLMFTEVDLCRNMLTNITAVGVTNGVGGTVATPFTTDVTDRSRIITSAISVSQLFTSSGVRMTLNWQVIDDRIMTDGFNVTCWLDGASLSCPMVAVSATQMTVSLGLSDVMEGQIITFSVGYSYELCINDILETMLTVDNIDSAPPQEVRDQRAVRVKFTETLFDANSVRVMFSSNCTASITVDYSNPLLITIPDTGANIGLCQYNIQLVDRATSTLTIGYPITGFFNAEGFPPLPSLDSISESNSAAAITGGIAGGLVLLLIIATAMTGGGLYLYFKNKPKQNDNDFENQQEVGSAYMEPQYEEISQPKVLSENFEMEENAAYGPVVSTGRDNCMSLW